MVTSLETAIIEIVADTDQFEASLNTELRNAFKKFERLAEKSIGNVDDAFDNLQRQVVSGFGQALFRVSNRGAASLDEVKEAAREVAVVMRSRVGEAIEDVSDSLVALGDAPGFEHLEDEAKEFARVLRTGLRDELQNVEVQLRQLGDLNDIDEIRAAVGRLAQNEMQLLDAALTNARQQIRALGGNDAALEDLTSDLAGINNQLARTAVNANRAASGMRSFRASTANTLARGDGFRQGLQRTRLALTDLRFLAIAAGGAIGVNLAGNAIRAAGEFQQLEAGIRTYIAGVEGAEGATAKTAEELNKIRQVALDTPFDFKELADATRRLAAFSDSTGRAGATISETFGTAREDVKDLSGLLSVLGQGSDALKPLIKAIGDVGARGRITGEEVRQFTNALPGFNTIQAIAGGLNEMGFAFDLNAVQAADFAKAGASAQQVLDALFIGVRNFPGAAEALEAQTLTLTGQFERFREAMQIAAADGFRPLADVLVPETISELGVLEQVVQDLSPAVVELGKGLSALTAQSIAGLGESFGDFGRDLGTLFQSEDAANATQALVDGFGDVLDIALPLIEVFFDLVIATKPFFDAFATGTRVLVEVLGALAEYPVVLQAIGAAFAAIKTAQFIQALTIMSALGGGLPGLFSQIGTQVAASASSLKQLAVAAGPVGAALAVAGVAIAGFIDHAREIDKVADESRETLEELTTAGESLGKDGFTAAVDALSDFRTESGKTAEQVRQDFSRVESEIGGRFSAAVGRLIPGLETGAETARIEFEGVERALAEFEQQTLTSAQGLSELRRVFDELGAGNLTGDQIRTLAQTLGVDLTQGADLAGEQLRQMIAEAGGVPELFKDVGFTAGEANSALSETATVADRVRNSIAAATEALQAQIDLQRAQIDPAFAALQAQEQLAGAQEAFKEVLADGEATLADRRQSAIDLAEAELNLRDASVKLAQTEGGLVGAQTALAELLDNVEGGPAATKLLGDAFDELAPQVQERLGEISREANQSIGVDMLAAVVVGTEGVIEAFEQMETETLATFLRLSEQAKTDMATVGQNAVSGLAGALESGASLSRIARAAAALARRIKSEMEEELETASPSKATARIGGYAAQGLVVGMDRLSGAVAKSAGGLAQNVLGPLSRVAAPAIAAPSGGNLQMAASGGSTSSTTNTKSVVVESPITVNASGTDPRAVASRISGAIMQRAGL